MLPTAVLLGVACPKIELDDAERLAHDIFGVTGQASALSGERDQNVRLHAPDGGSFLLKIANPGEALTALEAQNAALDHIARRDPSLPVPRVFSTMDGRRIAPVPHAGGTRLVRMLSYLPGTPLAGRRTTTEIRQAVGALAARLVLALANLPPSAAGLPFVWDLKHAGLVRPIVSHIGDAGQRALVQTTLDRFEADIMPVVRRLPWQPIHNDLNPNNILAGPGSADEITGVIDFGDQVCSPRIVELSIAVAHQIYGQPDPLQAACDVVAAFAAAAPPAPDELAILPGLVAVRLATRQAMAAWRAAAEPDAQQYDPHVTASMCDALDWISRTGDGPIVRALHEACAPLATPRTGSS